MNYTLNGESEHNTLIEVEVYTGMNEWVDVIVSLNALN